MADKKNYNRKRKILIAISIFFVALLYALISTVIEDTEGINPFIEYGAFVLLATMLTAIINNHYKGKIQDQKSGEQEKLVKPILKKQVIELDKTDKLLMTVSLALIFGGFIALFLILFCNLH